MKAVVYKGPYSVALDDVPEPRIEEPGDALIRITTTNICGSDLHMYEGRTNVTEGKVLGHENMGIVEATGPGVTRIRPLDEAPSAYEKFDKRIDGYTKVLLHPAA